MSSIVSANLSGLDPLGGTTLAPSRIDRLFQYALAVAAQEDDLRDRELGPIHLLKYAYLGDLAHAAAHGGATFTGVPWRFHHFGPWAEQAWRRIPEAIAAIGAAERRFAGQYQDDNVRWRLEPQGDPDTVVRGVPTDAALAIRRRFREFGTDTVSLLHFVYKTPPMLRAAPGDVLDFRRPPSEDLPADEVPAPPRSLPTLSKTKLKKLRERVEKKLAQSSPGRWVEPSPPPRFDEVFQRGSEWLDSLAGEPIEPDAGVLEFSADVWRSKARRESELP